MNETVGGLAWPKISGSMSATLSIRALLIVAMTSKCRNSEGIVASETGIERYIEPMR